MKLRSVLVLVLALCASLAIASDPFKLYILNGQATDTNNLTITFTNNHSGGDGAAFLAMEVQVTNTGATNTVYVDTDGTATSADIPVVAGATVTLTAGDTGFASIGVINAASTSTINVVAIRPN